MKSILVEENKEGKRAYESHVVSPKNLSILNNELTLKIIQELVKNPACALDLARSLDIHEQKIYYHIRKLDAAGIIKPLRNERRFGMTAKIYDVVSPVISTKLYEDGISIKDTTMKNMELAKFLRPFIEKGKLNARIVIGDPYPHGKFDKGSLDACYVADLSLFLGNVVHSLSFPCYKLDIRMTEKDLQENLVLIGNPIGNVVTLKVNKSLPIQFDEKMVKVVSKVTGKSYTDDLAGLIIRTKNPFNPKKEVLVLAGRRTRGTEAAIIGLTRHFDEVLKRTRGKKEWAFIVHGIDKDGDGVIDSVKFLE